MADLISSQVRHALRLAEGLYHRLVLLVGLPGSGKSCVVRELADELGTQSINVNVALADELLGYAVEQRALRVREILARVVASAPSPVLLDHTELLFDPRLKQDPLRLLQGVSRNRVVLASWSGAWNDGRLSYALVGHGEYRSYDAGEVQVVSMGVPSSGWSSSLEEGWL